MGRKRKIKEKDLLEKIYGSNGFYSVIASRLNVDWHTVDKAIKDSPAAQEAIKSETETTLDFVEGKAIERIKDGDGAMIRFYLATKGKKRGFTYDEKLGADETAEDNNINVICDGPEVDPVSIEAAESMEGKK